MGVVHRQPIIAIAPALCTEVSLAVVRARKRVGEIRVQQRARDRFREEERKMPTAKYEGKTG